MVSSVQVPLKKQLKAATLGPLHQQRQQEFKQDMLELNAARARVDYDQNAEAAKRWHEVKEHGERLVESGWQGYENWVSAMTQIFMACMKMNRAVNASDPLGTLTRALIARPFSDVVRWGVHSLGTWSLARKINVEFTLTQENLRFTDEGGLDCESARDVFERADGEKASDAQLMVFLAAIQLLLEDHGYQAKRENGIIHFYKKQENGVEERLTKTQFLELYNQQETIQHFEKELGISFVMQEPPAPGLAPGR